MKVNIPENMKSDGCSFPGPLKLFKSIMGASKYKEYCREHDFLRRYGVINWFKANLLLGRRIANDGLKGKIRAPFYVIFTTISYPFYGSGDNDYIEPGWEKYYDHYR